MLETSSAHQIPQVENIPYQPLLIKPTLNYKRFMTKVYSPPCCTGRKEAAEAIEKEAKDKHEKEWEGQF